MKLFERIELVELVPEDQARLLEQIVGVVQVADERVDVAEELRLMLPQAAPRSRPWPSLATSISLPLSLEAGSRLPGSMGSSGKTSVRT